MRTIIGGAASFCQLHSMAQQRFDCTQLITFLEGHETGGSSCHLHPSCSSNTMNIVLRAIRQIVIHYMSDICHVNPAGCNIRRDENSDPSASKSVDSTDAVIQTSFYEDHRDAETDMLMCVTESNVLIRYRIEYEYNC